jgi:hypothetical protein
VPPSSSHVCANRVPRYLHTPPRAASARSHQCLVNAAVPCVFNKNLAYSNTLLGA